MTRSHIRSHNSGWNKKHRNSHAHDEARISLQRELRAILGDQNLIADREQGETILFTRYVDEDCSLMEFLDDGDVLFRRDGNYVHPILEGILPAVASEQSEHRVGEARRAREERKERLREAQ